MLVGEEMAQKTFVTLFRSSCPFASTSQTTLQSVIDDQTYAMLCHGNFVPLKILVRDRFFQEKSFRVERFFLKKWTGPENFVPGYFFVKNYCNKLYDAQITRLEHRL